MSMTFILLGFSTPADNAPSFSTPVFSRNHSLYLQVISEDEHICDFEEVEKIDFDTFENLNNPEYKIGDKAVYAIKNHRNQLIQHNKQDMDEYLKSNIRSIVAYPYFYKSAREFSKLSAPEFLGCNNNKDFLLWQVLSNAAKEFIHSASSRKKRLSLASKQSHQNTSPSLPPKQSVLIHINQHREFRENYFERFITFAQSKHQRLAKEKTVLESIILSEYISHILPETAENLEGVRASLVKILEYTQHDSNSAPLQRPNITHVKIRRKYTENYKLIPRRVIDENTNGLSLIIYVTAAINHFQTNQERQNE